LINIDIYLSKIVMAKYQMLNLYVRKKSSISRNFNKIIWFLFGKPLLASFIPGTYWRKILLKIFGAKIGLGGKIKSRLFISEPWNLEVGDHCWFGEDLWIDNLSMVYIGDRVCLSQGVYICTGNHNYRKETFDLELKNIIIEDDCWIAAKSIIAPGTIMKRGSVASLGSLISGNIEEYGIYKGNPAKLFKKRNDKFN